MVEERAKRAMSTTLREPRISPASEGVVHRLDVVAVGIAHERTEVAGVVLRPHPRLVEHLGTQ